MTLTNAVAGKLKAQVGRAFFGQDEFFHHLMLCLFSGGHVLIEGVPGLGKTLAVRALAAALGVDFTRVQFTPDMLPADLIGANVFDLGTRTFHLKRGPLFTQLLLADEINRTPPKTQSALLEAMEEGRISIDGVDHPLREPFMVCATQNPVEFEGTYPLPEAQLDRFMMKLIVGYPTRAEEDKLLRATNSGFTSRRLDPLDIEQVVNGDELMYCRQEVQKVHVDDRLFAYILDIVTATRQSAPLLLGASPRAGLSLLVAAKTNALLEGRDYLIPEDIYGCVLPVMRHRLTLTPDAELEGLTPDLYLTQLLSAVRVPR